MTGRVADLFRLGWGLLYWNIRKSWFRFRGGRSACPCQSPSDSGRPLETGCEACVHWHRPAHFRRVCPLLVETAQGLRCSVDTADVRPFWGRAAGWYGGTLLALYLAAAVSIFAFLRTVGYPISIVHLVWPGSWHHVGQVRGWFFMERANRAFASGRTSEGMLYLRNAYEFDPSNLAVGLAFAQKLQLGQPAQSDQIFRHLLRDHPEQRGPVAHLWFRALLARGDFAGVQELARIRVVDDPANASAWMRALVFATRATGDRASLEQLAQAPHAAATPWRPLLTTELLRGAGRRDEARAQLHRRWAGAPGYALYYQVDELIDLGEGLAAVDLAGASRGQLDDTARATLLLRAYAAMDVPQSRRRLIRSLLEGPLNLPAVNLLCAHLVRYPDAEGLEMLYTRFVAAHVPFNDRSLESYLGLYCAAGASGDWVKLHALATAMQTRPSGHSLTLAFVEAFFRGQTTQTRAASLLPALPLSLELTYAMLERYSGPRVAVTPPSP